MLLPLKINAEKRLNMEISEKYYKVKIHGERSIDSCLKIDT